MEIKKKYQWARLQNNLYVIFDVETIRTFNDPKRGSLDIQKLQDLKNKLDEQEKLGQWLPVFLGHHESYENHTLSGFLDDFRIIGETMFCNIVNISEEVFVQIKRGEWPYRSPEYNASANKLTGLALLASQLSYFVFPMFFLEDEERKEINGFSLLSKSEKIIKFCGCNGSDKMDEKEKKPEEKTNPVESQEKMKCSMDEGIGEKIDNMQIAMNEMLELLKQILKAEKQESEQQEEFAEEKDETEEKEGEKNSSSVAYQLVQFEKKIGERLAKLENIQKFSALDKALMAFCNESGLPYNECFQTMQKLSSDADRKIYIDSLKDINRFSGHRLSGMAGYSQVIADEKYVDKYVDVKEKMYAQKASRAYRETLLLPDKAAVKKFSSMWTEEKWIDHCVAESKVNPNYIEEISKF